MELETIGLLLLAGFFSGAVNTVAGGGSILTLPALMLAGLPPDVANGSNRVGVLMQTLSAHYDFRRNGVVIEASFPLRQILVPTIAGAAVGALSASAIPRHALQPILLGALLLMTFAFAFRPALLEPDEQEVPLTPKEVPRGQLALFAAGVYGGFLQAGSGFVFLAILSGMLRHPLRTANAAKIGIIGLYSIVSLSIFAMAGQIDWVLGVVCGLGAVSGSIVGVRFAVHARPKVLRLVVVAAVMAATGRLMWKEWF